MNLSKDKTALIGIESGLIDEASARFFLRDNNIYLYDKVNKVKFTVSDTIRSAILNKGYFILCHKNPFEFFKVNQESGSAK